MPIYLEIATECFFDRVLAKTNFDLGTSGRPPALGTPEGETRGGSTPGGGIFFRKIQKKSKFPKYSQMAWDGLRCMNQDGERCFQTFLGVLEGLWGSFWQSQGRRTAVSGGARGAKNVKKIEIFEISETYPNGLKWPWMHELRWGKVFLDVFGVF